MTSTPVIVWFRRDLRLADNPALDAAIETGRPVIALYIYETDREKAFGAATDWWLHYSLKSLSKDLADRDISLCIKSGEAQQILTALVTATEASHLVWNRRYEADRITVDKKIKATLSEAGVDVQTFRANLLSEPWEVKTKSGDNYYKVFSPYWRAAKDQTYIAPPIPVPTSIKSCGKKIDSLALDDLALLPTQPDWGSKLLDHWQPGEAGARENLESFLDGPVETYADERNRPDKRGTSRLSPYLAFGEISPRQIWSLSQDMISDENKPQRKQIDKFLSEVGWREFSYVLLFHNPDLGTENFKENFNKFPWDKNPDALEAWQMGQTGYPFVDAGMRELWATGWQHNRVRMVTASFLIKHLMIDWREGEAWFWDTLVDADPANNAASWQWVAGSGADAAPYFRIFNPFSQGQKFDPNGDYVRRWVPELKRLPNKFIHTPWEAPALVLKEAGVTLGKTYPKPIVDHKMARERALEAYKHTKS